MVKTPKTEITTPKQEKKNRHLTTKLIAVVVVAAAGYGVWKNPQVLAQIRKMWSSWHTDEYQQQISSLENKIKDLESRLNYVAEMQNNNQDYSEMQEKVAAIEKTNLNVIDSKADVKTVLGLIMRTDKLEEKVDTMAKVTDEGALILTATMLVKDAAERGGQFEYEAEVLQQIAQSDIKFKEPIAQIVKLAPEGIIAPADLQKEFGKIYAQMLKAQKAEFEKSWKDRLNSKLSEIVQIKRVKEDAPQFTADSGLEKIKQLTADENFKAVLRELNSKSNAELMQNENLQKWQQQVQNYLDFNQAVTKISASSMALMKVNFIRNTTQKK